MFEDGDEILSEVITSEPAASEPSNGGDAGAEAKGAQDPSSVAALVDKAEGTAFERAMRGIRATMQEGRTPKEGGEKEADADAQGREADGKQQDGAKSQGAEKKPDGEDGERGKGLRYVILGADGQPLPDAQPWPEGAQVRFSVDQKPVTVKSLDQLVTMAQRGALFDKEQSRSAKLDREVESVRQRLARVNEASQETLLAVLFGTEDKSAEEIRAMLEEELAPFRDPRFREGQEALRAQREAQEAAEAEESEAAQERTAAIWSHADEVFEQSLGDFPYLDKSDAATAKSVLHQRYLAAHKEATTQLARQAKAERWSPRKFAEQVEAIATQELSVEALREVMQGINDHYAARLKGKGSASNANEDEDADDGEDLEAEADAHNEKTDRKLAQRARGRVIRGGGSSPSSGVAIPNLEGKTFAERMAAMRAEFRRAAR